MNDFAARLRTLGRGNGRFVGDRRSLRTPTRRQGRPSGADCRREDRLKKLADEMGRRHQVRTRVVSVDLAADDFLQIVAAATHDLDIGLLVNNAGVLSAGRFLDHDLMDGVSWQEVLAASV